MIGNSFTTTETLVWMIGKATANAHRTGKQAAVLFVTIEGLDEWPDAEWLTSERLINDVRGADSAAQLDSWEYAVLCDSLAYSSDAETIARRLVDTLQLPIEVCAGTLATGNVRVGLTPLGLPDAQTYLRHGI